MPCLLRSLVGWPVGRIRGPRIDHQVPLGTRGPFLLPIRLFPHNSLDYIYLLLHTETVQWERYFGLILIVVVGAQWLRNVPGISDYLLRSQLMHTKRVGGTQ